MSLNNCDDTSSSDDSECGPLWDSSDDSDSDDQSPPKKKVKFATKKESDDLSQQLSCENTEAITVTVDENGTPRSKLFTGTVQALQLHQQDDADDEDDDLHHQQQQQLEGEEYDGGTAAGGGEDGEEEDDEDRELYEVRRFSNLRDVITYMDHYQQETLTHFTSFSRHGAFGDEKRIPNVQRGRIYFESLKGKCGMPIAYDGVPFIHVGRWSFGCHQGVDRNQKQKQQYHQKRREKCKKEGIKLETRQRTSKKVNCPAEIYISHVTKFPHYQVSEDIVAENCLPSDQVRRGIKRKLSEQYKHSPESIVCQHWYYVRIPHPWAHKGHPVMATLRTPDVCAVPSGTKVTLNAEAVARMYDKRKTAVEGIVMRTKEPVDARVLDKIRTVYKEGVQQERDIREVVNTFVKEELFAGQSPPPYIFRRFNPTHKDIANEIAKAREELRAAKMCEQRQVCSSLVSEIAHLIPAVEDEAALDQMQEQLSHLYELVKGAVPACISNPEDNVVTETTIDDKEESVCGPGGGILLSDQAAIVIPQTMTMHHTQQQHHQQQHHQQQQHQQQQHQQQQQQHHQHIQLDHSNATIVHHQGVPVTSTTVLAGHHQQQQQHHHTLHTQQQQQPQQQQQHTITYHQNYIQPATIHTGAINTLNAINTTVDGGGVGGGGGGTVHTINAINTTVGGGGTVHTLNAAAGVNTFNTGTTTYEIANIQPHPGNPTHFQTTFRERKLNTMTNWYP